MKKINIDVSGMHCKSCELILEKSLKKAKNIKSVNANEKRGIVELCCEGGEPDISELKAIIEEAGYQIGKAKSLPWINKDPRALNDLFTILLSLLAAYLLLGALGLDLGSYANLSSPTFSVALIVGLTAGISSCMALVGGLVLGVSAKWSEDHKSLTRFQKFEPHLYFNIGRILGFALFGGILGIFGKIFALSPFAIGTMTVAAGMIMLLLGINLSEISPKISSFTLSLPKAFGRNVGKDNGGSKHKFALTTGALTFFLPCGFTLAMQAYAITTGNFVDGALIMMAFAIGTAPGLLGVGGLSSWFSGEKAKKFFKATGVLVILLSFFNISNGYTLMSLGGGSVKTGVATDPNEVQEIKMVQDGGGYSPREFHIKPNTKTRWIIESTNPFSCATQLEAPSIGVSKTLVKGENVIEFVSPADGVINFSCSMGMYDGKIYVDGGATGSSNIINTASADSKGSGDAFGGCSAKGSAGSVGGCGGKQAAAAGSSGGCPMMKGKAQAAENSIKANPTTDNTAADSTELSAVYTSAGMSPNNFNLAKGKTYTLTIDVKETISGCMSTILIPGFDENVQYLEGGTKVKFTIKADKAGQFPLICAMGVPHGYLNIK